MNNIVSNPVDEKKEINNLDRRAPFLKIIVVFVSIIILLVGILAYLFISKSPLIEDRISTFWFDSSVCEEFCNEESGVEETETITTLNNEGWGLYQYPEYGFSIEVPSNNSFYPGYEQSRYLYSWGVKNIDVEMLDEYQLNEQPFDDIAKIIKVSYEPYMYPDLGTEIDALNPSIITFSFFENKQKATIEDVENQFKAKIENLAESGDYEINDYTTTFEKFENWNSFSYDYSDVMYGKNGIVVLTDEYIVKIDKTLIFSDGKELEIVNEVLDTIKLSK